MKAIANLVSSWRKRTRNLFQSEATSEYQIWRQKLFRDRLRISLWVILGCIIVFAIKDFAEVYNPEFSQRVIQQLGRERLKLYRDRTIYPYSAIAIAWLICWYRWYRDRFRKYTVAVFFCLVWSVTLFSPIIGTILGEPSLGDVYHWGLVFLASAIVIPVGWYRYLIAEVALIAYYIGIMPLLGIYTSVEVDLTFIYDPDTLVTFFIACGISTAAVYLYERLQQREFESRRELKVFLHSVTHDLRTPTLASSIVLQNLLQKSGQQLTIDRSILERLHQGSDRQVKMINSLVQAHQTEVNGIAIAPQSCYMDEIVNSVLTDLQPLLIQNQAKIDNRLADLPSVKVDPLQLWRVYSNLITNALKHNPPGIEITIDATVKDLYLYCTVKDDGVGIPIERSERLFQLYSRGKRARYMPGLGLGLYLCRQIINAHGGEIGFDSYPGKGTTFWFTVPVEPKFQEFI